MRELKFVGFFLSIATPILVSASDKPVLAEHALREACGDISFSQANMHECLAKKAEDSQQELQHAETQMFSTFTKWDEWESVITRAKTNLVASNQSFAKYRHDQCEFAASLGGRLAVHLI